MNVLAILLVLGLAMMVVERILPGRRLREVQRWWLRAIPLNAIQAGCVYIAGVGWEKWMSRNQPWTLQGDTAQAALLGYFVMTFVYYWWHRWRHASNFLWRRLHQMHHSPQRIEIMTSFYKHPLEILANGILTSTVLYLIVGLTPEAASGAVLLSGIAEFFYHWNIATPRRLGYFIQRPESHCVHHQEGLHSFNYSDLPLWDMLFGTYRNPEKWSAQCGFGANGENRFFDLLRGKPVSSY